VAGDLLAGYVDADGRARELLALPGHGGSVLVLDRDGVTLCDRRLIAHLGADEPPENAALVCRHYLEDRQGRWCRRVQPEDLQVAPFAPPESQWGDDLRSLHASGSPHASGPIQPCNTPNPFDRAQPRVEDRRGNVYRLGPFSREGSTARLGWRRCSRDADLSTWEQVKLRDVIAALESYEPVRILTEQALARYRDDPHVSLTRLYNEFERLCTSPIVLNRGLREAVLDAIARRGASMSEIALRCGVVKRDRHGNISGETSWLARRVGLMPEGGELTVTPWIHSDVLAAISRKGLGVSPREVELQ
jgi:hypothetical protein